MLGFSGPTDRAGESLGQVGLERARGFELSTPSLVRLCVGRHTKSGATARLIKSRSELPPGLERRACEDGGDRKQPRRGREHLTSDQKDHPVKMPVPRLA